MLYSSIKNSKYISFSLSVAFKMACFMISSLENKVTNKSWLVTLNNTNTRTCGVSFYYNIYIIIYNIILMWFYFLNKLRDFTITTVRVDWADKEYVVSNNYINL